MKAVLSGGGTAGHINPALALAENLEKQGCRIYFAGTPRGVEAKLVPQAGIEFKAFEAAGFDRSHPLSLLKALKTVLSSRGKAKQWLSEIKPDVVVGFGGYVSIPVGMAAQSLGIPVVVHEQNSVMGLANQQLSKKAFATCLTYAGTSRVPQEAKVRVCGNPVRESVFEATREEGRRAFEVPDDALMLLVTGGSLGARHLNQALVALKEKLLAYENLYIVHVCGPKEYDTVMADLALTEEQQQRWKLFGYTQQMGLAMAACDCIVSRAGATSLAEIAARAIPALLVPFPFATEDHQTTNARSCVEAGAAFMIADEKVESEEFASLLAMLIEDEGLRARMRKAAQEQKAQDAAGLLADVVREAARNQEG